jgi:hypothetical protein
MKGQLGSATIHVKVTKAGLVQLYVNHLTGWLGAQLTRTSDWTVMGSGTDYNGHLGHLGHNAYVYPKTPSILL